MKVLVVEVSGKLTDSELKHKAEVLGSMLKEHGVVVIDDTIEDYDFVNIGKVVVSNREN